MTKTAAIKRQDEIFDAPNTLTTAGGLQVLLLDTAHLHYKCKKLPLIDIQDASCLTHKVIPVYYYSDVVLMKNGEATKIIKGQQLTGGRKYLNTCDVADFLNAINHSSITKTLIV